MHRPAGARMRAPGQREADRAPSVEAGSQGAAPVRWLRPGVPAAPGGDRL